MCATPGCPNKRDIKNRRRICYTCKSKRYRESSPLVASYHSKKSKAKHKDIPFSLTLKQYEKICDDTGYLELKGKGKSDLQMDRKIIDPYLGYSYSNVQIITMLENVRKGQIEKRMRKGWATKGMDKQPGDPF